MSTLYVGKRNAVLVPAADHAALLNEEGDLIDEDNYTQCIVGGMSAIYKMSVIYKHDAVAKSFSLSGINARALTRVLVDAASNERDKTMLKSLDFDVDYVFDTQQCVEMTSLLRQLATDFASTRLGVMQGAMLDWLHVLTEVFAYGAQSGFVIIL